MGQLELQQLCLPTTVLAIPRHLVPLPQRRAISLQLRTTAMLKAAKKDAYANLGNENFSGFFQNQIWF